MEAAMDWKLEQQRQEKKQAVGKKESVRRLGLMAEMERDFTQIFGGAGNAVFINRCRQAGDPVRRSESSSRQCKEAKAD
jgi:hypothetical protein